MTDEQLGAGSPERRQLAAVFSSLPDAIALLVGPEHRFALANDAYRRLVGDRDLLGLTVREALPELEDERFVDLLDRVFATGEPYVGSETTVRLAHDRGDVPAERFLNFTCLPSRAGDGEIDGILVHAADVTELVEARRTVESLARDLAGERRRLEAVIEQMPVGVAIAEAPSGRLVAANHGWREFFGVSLRSLDGIAGHRGFAARHPDGRPYEAAEYPLARSVSTGESVAAEEMTILRADGQRRIIEISSAPIVEEGRVELCVAMFFDVTERRLLSLLVERTRSLLELVAAGAPLSQTLDSLVRMVEEHTEGALLASVHLLDRDGVHLRYGAAPSMSDAYNLALDGVEIGPASGPCGTAAYRRELVVLDHPADDSGWGELREPALEYGLRGCWSMPIMFVDGEVLGTFTLYQREGRKPGLEEQRLSDTVMRTASVAIERTRLEEVGERLLVSEQAAREAAERNLRVVEALHRVGQAINASLDLGDVVQVVADAAVELSRAEFGALFYNVIGDDGESRMLYALSGAPRSAFEGFPLPRNSAIFAPTFRGESVVRIADVLADPRYGKSPPHYGLPEGHLPVRSYLAAPVTSGDGEVLGGLFLGHEETGVFGEEAERLVVGIAAQAAVAIERARLYVREQQARAEAEQRAQAALALEHVDDGVCLVDVDGIVRIWNLAATSITGLAPEEVVGRPLGEAAPALAAVVAELSTTADPEDGGHRRTLPLRLGDRDLALSISGIRLRSGVVYTFGDRTREMRLEQMRSDIVATVSHELRTPLAAVFGAGRTLGRPEIAADPSLRDQFVEMIVNETERLTRVVNEILTVSELQVRGGGATLAPVDLVALARRAVELAALRADGVALELDAAEVPEVAADEDKLQQVVANLVDNAIKYGGARGRVIIRIRSHGDRVRLGVVDSGPGIPADEAERIFDRFYRLDPEQRRGVAGTGLGLYISRELVVEMGGRIWVEPGAGGHGSTFVVELARASGR